MRQDAQRTSPRAGWPLAAWLCAALIVLAAAASSAELLALTGRVVDDAGLLDAEVEARLSERLAAFERKSSDQIVVATIESLDGEAIEPYANRLFRAWGLGQAGEDNGILLLVAVADRRMRIEVGYGLEGTLTDLHAKMIIENTMVPAFRAGDFAGGITGAVDDIITVLEGNAAELEERARRFAEEENREPVWPMVLFLLLWGTLFFGGMAVALLPPIFGRKIAPGRYEWLGIEFDTRSRKGGSSGRSSGWSSGSSGGFSGGGGSSGGGGASGSW